LVLAAPVAGTVGVGVAADLVGLADHLAGLHLFAIGLWGRIRVHWLCRSLIVVTFVIALVIFLRRDGIGRGAAAAANIAAGGTLLDDLFHAFEVVTTIGVHLAVTGPFGTADANGLGLTRIFVLRRRAAIFAIGAGNHLGAAAGALLGVGEANKSATTISVGVARGRDAAQNVATFGLGAVLSVSADGGKSTDDLTGPTLGAIGVGLAFAFPATATVDTLSGVGTVGLLAIGIVGITWKGRARHRHTLLPFQAILVGITF
jgi:hypothetical protein